MLKQFSGTSYPVARDSVTPPATPYIYAQVRQIARMSTKGAAKIPDMFLRGLKRKTPLSPSSKDNQKEAVVVEKKEKREEEKKMEKETKPMEKEQEKTDAAAPSASLSAAEEEHSIVDESGPLSLRALLRDPGWQRVCAPLWDKKHALAVETFLSKEYDKKKEIFPPRGEIFSAFELTPLERVRVVVIGQDPYHGDGQAHGLSFSVKRGVKPPPSLKNIYKELETDVPGFKTPDHGYLEGWARQGVFMLNASLTVEAHKANSHAKCGWQDFTDDVIRLVSRELDHVVFLLWGGFAHKKEALIDGKKHKVIKTAHPSPLSVTKWRGCRCFSQANDALEQFGLDKIDWTAL